MDMVKSVIFFKKVIDEIFLFLIFSIETCGKPVFVFCQAGG